MANWLIVLVTAASTLLIAGLVLFVWRALAARENRVRTAPEHIYTPRDGQFMRAMSGLFTASWHGGNAVQGLRNGDEIFPAMLDAIASARYSITFETYIYWSGDVGRRFTNALAERARAGVQVHVLLDWFGSLHMDRSLMVEMVGAGVEVQRYHKPRLQRPQYINHRTHRKLLVVDGRVGFSGGVGIADAWTGNAQDPDHWRETHFRLEGPCVAGLQRAFMDNWIKSMGRVLHSDRYFPPLASAGNADCQVFQSSPEGGSDSVRLMFLLAITAASESIRISTAYFVPDGLAIRTLQAARARGVAVEIIVPGEHNDSNLVRLVSRARYGPLIRAGIAIYEYQTTLYHTKVMIIDGVWTSIGSTNFDNRSFRLNDEANLNVYDRALARQQVEWFEEDKARSKRIELEEWSQRPPCFAHRSDATASPVGAGNAGEGLPVPGGRGLMCAPAQTQSVRRSIVSDALSEREVNIALLAPAPSLPPGAGAFSVWSGRGASTERPGAWRGRTHGGSWALNALHQGVVAADRTRMRTPAWLSGTTGEGR